MAIRPRRSVLYMPGSNARAIETARTLPVDAVILDLEDSVAPDGKAAARKQVADAVAAGGFGAREVVIRINGLDTEWWLDDLNAAAKAKPDAVLVPKVSSPSHLEDVAERLVDISADQKIRIWAMMETPLAMLNNIRSPNFPDVPTLADLGHRGAVSRAWFGLFVPTGTPHLITDKIAEEFTSIINEPAFKERHLTNRSLVVGTNVGEQFAEELRKDHADAAQVVKDSGLTPQ